MDRLSRLKFALLGGIFCATTVAFGAEDTTDWRLLQTTLRVGGPQVWVAFPFGLQYPAGVAMPMQVKIQNNGPEFSADVYLIEGDGENGPRTDVFSRVRLSANGTSQSKLVPLRLPGVRADVYLTIRRAESESGVGAKVFRASLANVVQPLPSNSRVLLACASLRTKTPHGSLRVSARDFPDQDWMFESIDLVLLADETFRDVSPAGRAALRHWLLGGGRLMIASEQALGEAMASGLLPYELSKLPRVDGKLQIPASRAEWEKLFGLQNGDVLRENLGRPVYVKAEIGLGRVAFLFPRTEEQIALKFGLEVINDPVLQRQAEKLPDARIQSDRMNAFTGGTPNSARLRYTLLWISLGAAMLGLGLAMSLMSRSRVEALGWPLSAAALLAVLLANFFPPPSLSVSRIQWVQQSADGRASSLREWAYVESFRDPEEIALAGPRNGSLMDVHSDYVHLSEAPVRWLHDEDQMHLSNVVVSPDRPVLLESSAVLVQEANSTPLKLADRDGSIALALSAPPAGVQVRGAIWVHDKGALEYLEDWRAPQGFKLRKYEGTLASVRQTMLTSGTEKQHQAWSTALSWATLNAVNQQKNSKSREGRIVFWGESSDEPGRSEFLPGLVEVDGSAGSGSNFTIWSAEVRAIQ